MSTYQSDRSCAAVLTLAIAGVLAASSASAQTASAVEATRVVLPFAQLNSSPEGRAVLVSNLNTTIAINNNSSAAQRAQAIADNALLGGALSISVALGSKLDGIFTAASNGGSPVLAATGTGGMAIRQLAGIALGNSVTGKNYFANGTSNGTVPFNGLPLPPGGTFNIYDNAYGIVPFSQNPFGDSRPYQVARSRLVAVAPELFGGSNNTSSSFPSGHSTSGTSEGLLLAMMVPERYQELMYRASEEGYSRLVLGVHYALDVIGGRIIATQQIAQMLNNNPAYFSIVQRDGSLSSADPAGLFATGTAAVRQVLTTACGTSIAVCAAAGAPDRFSDYATMRADYLYRMTYDLPAMGPTNLAPVVPVGAEVLLATRFPYLSAAQRREVLATTEVASGGALDDGSGWARLNLFDAAAGYGAFNSEVRVSMDAALGGANAIDVWRNNIGGSGSLVKEGSGVLALTGANTFTGAVTILGGTLAVTGSGSIAAASAVNNSAVLSLVDGSPTGRVALRNYTGGPGSVIALDVRLSGPTPAADQLTIASAGAGSSSRILLNDLSDGSAGVALSTPLPIIAGAGTYSLVGGTYNKGLFDYRLDVGSAGQINLVSAPSADAARVGTLATAMGDIWSASADAWQDRQSSMRDSADGVNGMWLTGFGRWSERDQAVSGYDLRPTGVIGGIDAGVGGEGPSSGSARFGVMFGYVDALQDFDDTATQVNYHGTMFGASASLRAANGLFGDIAAKMDLLTLRLDTPGLSRFGSPRADADVHTGGVITTFGYHHAFGARAFVEPLVGVTYIDSNDELRLAGNRVAWDSEDGLRARAGVRGGAVLASSEHQLLSVTGQAIWNTFSDASTTTLTATAGGAPFTFEDQKPGSFTELGAGLQYEAGMWSAGLRAAYRSGDDYKAEEVNLTVRKLF